MNPHYYRRTGNERMNMNRFKARSAALVAFACVGSTFAAPALFARTSSEGQQPPAVSADQAFTAFADRYFDGLFHFYPANATWAGIHSYDSELPGYSKREIEAEIARSRQALDELSHIPKDTLSHDNRVDARLLESSIRSELVDLDEVRMWEKDPDFYNTQIGVGVYTLVQRNFAPVNERLKSLVARLKRVPSIIASARDNLQNPPSVYTTIATRQVAAQVDFFKNQLPQAVAGARNAALKAEFEEANRQAIQEYGKFLEYLKNDLAPRSHGSFAIGAENYRKKLLYDEMVDIPVERLLKIGDQALAQTQADFKTTAAIIDPSKSPAEVYKQLSKEHPDAEHLIPESQSVLEGLRKFITSHQVVTILSPEIPRVIETPPFMRVLTFASMDSPGPLEENSTEAFYNVTLPERDWSEKQKEEHLQFFNRYAILTASIHEVFPGHYTQFLWLKRAPTKARKLLGSASNAEGWAHYSEQMMLEQGYGEGDPKLLLEQLHDALLRLCRYEVGLRMHTRGMTLEEAIEFFKKEGYQQQANAEREAMRGTADPTYLVYTLGKLQVLKLRDDYRMKVGDRFSLKEFHDRFLSFGYPPIKLIREEMLGNDSPTL